MLSALSYQGVLARGFAIIRDGTGAMVRRATSIKAGAALGIELSDGEVRVQAIEDGTSGGRERMKSAGTTSAAASVQRGPVKRGTQGSGNGGQGSLF